MHDALKQSALVVDIFRGVRHSREVRDQLQGPETDRDVVNSLGAVLDCSLGAYEDKPRRAEQSVKLVVLLDLFDEVLVVEEQTRHELGQERAVAPRVVHGLAERRAAATPCPTAAVIVMIASMPRGSGCCMGLDSSWLCRCCWGGVSETGREPAHVGVLQGGEADSRAKNCAVSPCALLVSIDHLLHHS